MRYWVICVIVTAVALLLTAAAGADTEDVDANHMKPFVSVLSGVSLFSNLNINDLADETSSTFPGTYEMERPDFTVGGAVGIGDRDLDHQIRVDYRRSSQQLSGTQLRVLSIIYQPKLKLHLSSLGWVARDASNDPWFYLGAGLGAAQAKTSLAGETDGVPVTGIVDNWAFAYQIAVGFVYPLNQHLGIEIGYRYFGTTDFEVVNELTTPLIFQPQLLHTNKLTLGTNELTLGLRYQFH